MRKRNEQQSEKMRPDAICTECKADLSESRQKLPGAVVHCTGYPKRVWAFGSDTGRANAIRVHHGRWLIKCVNPDCAQLLGCDECLRAPARQILCLTCETYLDGDVVMGSGSKQIKLRSLDRSLVGIERALPASDREL